MDEKDKAQKKELKLISPPPAMVVDGNGVALHPSGEVDLSFFQIVGEEEKAMLGSVIFKARMNIKKITRLRDTLSQIIEDNEKKQKDKEAKSKDK